MRIAQLLVCVSFFACSCVSLSLCLLAAAFVVAGRLVLCAVCVSGSAGHRVTACTALHASGHGAPREKGKDDQATSDDQRRRRRQRRGERMMNDRQRR